MNNLYLYNKYIIYPQYLLKFPYEENKLINYGIHKVRMNIFMVNEDNLPLLFLLNICLLMRILFNENIYVKKLSYNKYILNKVHLQITLGSYEVYLFLDLFKNFLMNSFEFYSMGLNYKDFDIYGNYVFQFNYYDPIFTTRNVIMAWSPLSKIRFMFYFYSKEKQQNKIYLKYLGIKNRIMKKKRMYF